MKVIVNFGSVKFNDTIYKKGDAFELPANEVESLVKEGVVEVVKKEPKPKPKKKDKKEAKPEVKKVEKELPKDDLEPTPTIEWTQKELVEFAGKKGIEVDVSMTKQEILEALKGGEEIEHKAD